MWIYELFNTWHCGWFQERTWQCSINQYFFPKTWQTDWGIEDSDDSADRAQKCIHHAVSWHRYVHKDCLKLVDKLLKNQQTTQYVELNKFINFTFLSSFFLLLKWLPLQVLHYWDCLIHMSQILKPLQFFLYPLILKLWTYFVKT
jgi:hypothetical protein